MLEDIFGGAQGVPRAGTAVEFVIPPQEGDDPRPGRGARVNGSTNKFDRPGGETYEDHRVEAPQAW